MGRPKINIGTCCECDRPAVTKGRCQAHYKKLYYKANIEKESSRRAEYNRLHKDKMAVRKKNREQVDLNYRLANRLRHRLNTAIKGGGSMDHLGCSLEELKKHIESQFQPGMTWNNWTTNGWHIDHKVPLASLDLTIEDNLKIVCHYTNLRPLWWRDNLSRRYGQSS